MDIFKRISEHRTEKDSLSWTGTFAEYIELLRKNPGLARTAHSRVYDMIASQGINDQVGHKSYKFFNKEIFGLDRAIEKLVEEYFHSAARRLDVRKRILLLMGPVSGGKSTIVTMLKTRAGAICQNRFRGCLCD